MPLKVITNAYEIIEIQCGILHVKMSMIYLNWSDGL